MSISLQLNGKIAHITIDDGKANAVNHAFITEMNHCLDEAEQHAAAIIIAGRPGVFCGGFDLKVLQRSAPEGVEALIDAGGDLALRLFSSNVPIIALCTGHAIAQGAAYLLSADLRIGVSGDFKIGLNETLIDMVLRHFGPTLAKARLNKRFWMRAAVLGELFDPEAAIDVGYLDLVVSPDESLNIAMEKAAVLSELPGAAYHQNKQLIYGDAFFAMSSKEPM